MPHPVARAVLRHLAVAAAVALGVGTAAVARADELDARAGAAWTLDVGVQVRWLGARSAAAVAPGAMFGPRVTLSRRLVALPGPRGAMSLAAYLRFGGGDATGEVFQTLVTRLSQLAITGGARLAMPVWRGLTAVAQVEAGAADTRVVIGDGLTPVPVDDAAWGLLGAATIGAAYTQVVRGHYSFGIALDVGYVATAPVAIRAEPSMRPAPGLSIPTVYAALGDLDTRGIMGAISIHGGF